jgi:flagellar hook-basal body complex protein FliE
MIDAIQHISTPFFYDEKQSGYIRKLTGEKKEDEDFQSVLDEEIKKVKEKNNELF